LNYLVVGFFRRFRAFCGFMRRERGRDFMYLCFELFETSSQDTGFLVFGGFGIDAGFLVASLDAILTGGMLTVTLE
jgi:hypothetical protein